MHVIGIVICTMIRFLLMYSKQFLSQYNHSKREYDFIYFYLCLAFQPRNCQFLLYSTDFAPHVECTLIKIYLIKCTLVYTSAHMLKLYLQSLYNTILASKEFFFSNKELETKWFKVETHAIINSWIGRPNTCHGVY